MDNSSTLIVHCSWDKDNKVNLDFEECDFPINLSFDEIKALFVKANLKDKNDYFSNES